MMHSGVSADNSSSEALPVASAGAPATLRRTANGFVLAPLSQSPANDAARSAIELERVHVAATRRCKTLQALLETSEVGDLVPIGLEQQILVDWLDFSMQSQPSFQYPFSGPLGTLLSSLPLGMLLKVFSQSSAPPAGWLLVYRLILCLEL